VGSKFIDAPFIGHCMRREALYNTLLSNILLSRLIPCAEEIIGDHKCGFQRNRSTTDHIFCIRQILEKRKNGNTMRQCISYL
jgi:hypothetical protein